MSHVLVQPLKATTGILAHCHSVGMLLCQRDALTKSTNPANSDAATAVNTVPASTWKKQSEPCAASSVAFPSLLMLLPLRQKKLSAVFGSLLSFDQIQGRSRRSSDSQSMDALSLTSYPSAVWDDQCFRDDCQKLTARPKSWKNLL